MNVLMCYIIALRERFRFHISYISQVALLENCVFNAIVVEKQDAINTLLILSLNNSHAMSIFLFNLNK